MKFCIHANEVHWLGVGATPLQQTAPMQEQSFVPG